MCDVTLVHDSLEFRGLTHHMYNNVNLLKVGLQMYLRGESEVIC